MKKVLIAGITGQDGTYLAEFLLAKGYDVHGIIRRASTFNPVALITSTKTRTPTDKQVHFRRTIIRRINLDIVAPVEPHTSKDLL